MAGTKIGRREGGREGEPVLTSFFAPALLGRRIVRVIARDEFVAPGPPLPRLPPPSLEAPVARHPPLPPPRREKARRHESPPTHPFIPPA
jgi:hypothetical protein